MASSKRGLGVEVVAIIFLTLSWVVVALRCYVKMFITRLFRIDDWFALITMVAFTFYCSFVIAGATRGTGQLKSDISEKDSEASMEWWYCGEVTYGITTCLMKISVGIFLLQICVNKTQRIIIWMTIITTSIFTAYYVPLIIYQCHPVSYFWTKANDGWCLRPNIVVNSTYTHGALSAIVDWTLGTIPIFLVRSLQLNKKTKVLAAVLLALGSIGSTATIIRIPFISQLQETSEFLYYNANLSIWSTIEAGIGITASSLACMRPLFQAFSFGSRLVDLRSHKSPFRNSPRAAYNASNESDPECLRTREHLARSILVTTIIDTSSARESRDLEMLSNCGKDDGYATRLTERSAWENRKVEFWGR